jgi:hypothetical protein
LSAAKAVPSAAVKANREMKVWMQRKCIDM